MQKKILQINDSKITDEGVKAITDFYKTMAVDSLSMEGLDAFVTGIDSPYLNVVMDVRVSEVDSVVIEQFANFFKKHDVPWYWFVTANGLVTKDLSKAGFTLDDRSPGMYFDLTKELPHVANHLFKILPAKNDLEDWIESINEGFQNEDNCVGFRTLNFNLAKQGNKTLQHFVAYYDNVVAASGTLFLSQNSVMIHNVATKTAFQKKGLASYITVEMMRIAKQLGYRHCYLDSSEEALNLYKRLGFKIYCETRIFGRN